MSLRQSPLHHEHEALGAKFVEFGGWTMPLSYPMGTIGEHLACRNGAVAFDVSHLGTIRVRGASALQTLQQVFTNDLSRIEPGRAQYTHLLDATDASVLDDCIIWWLGPDEFDVMPNASNTSRVLQATGGTDVTTSRAIIAVQGPDARRLLASVAPEAAAVPHFAVAAFEFEGERCTVAGTGYTGEDGVECAVPNNVAASFWRLVLGTGVLPAGLGARDTLRLEAALPLHGHELGPGITSLQAGLSWVVSFDKGPFIGREALLAERDRGVLRRLRAIVSTTRRPPHPGDVVLIDAEPVGIVTSGNYSPLLERGIALSLLNADVEIGLGVEIETRGTRTPASVVRPPFTKLVGAPGGHSQKE